MQGREHVWHGPRPEDRFLMQYVLGIAAKNVVLGGVKSVTIYDPETIAVQDLGTQVRVSVVSCE